MKIGIVFTGWNIGKKLKHLLHFQTGLWIFILLVLKNNRK